MSCNHSCNWLKWIVPNVLNIFHQFKDRPKIRYLLSILYILQLPITSINSQIMVHGVLFLKLVLRFETYMLQPLRAHC